MYLKNNYFCLNKALLNKINSFKIALFGIFFASYMNIGVKILVKMILKVDLYYSDKKIFNDKYQNSPKKGSHFYNDPVLVFIPKS
jgi:hypothetical protein